MKMLRFVCIGVLVLVAASLAWTRSGSYMNPNTGAPSEGNCTGCHGGAPLNSGSGSVGLIAPSEYQPDNTLTLMLWLENPGQVRWGFEITALDGGNQAAGTFVITDATNTQETTDGGNSRQYVFHTSPGSYDGVADTSNGWTFDWVAPGTGTGDVTFWFAGLAANSSGTGGDSTYTSSVTLTEAVGTGIGDDGQAPRQFELMSNFPNPFNAGTMITYDLTAAGHVSLSIFNSLGRRVRILDEGTKTPGLQTLYWDGRDEHGRNVSSGVYFYRLYAGGVTDTRRMLLLK